MIPDALSVVASGVLFEASADSKSGNIGPGLIAFLIVAVLAVVTFLLIRSMLSHIKKVPPSFDEPAGNDPSADAGSDH